MKRSKSLGISASAILAAGVSRHGAECSCRSCTDDRLYVVTEISSGGSYAAREKGPTEARTTIRIVDDHSERFAKAVGYGATRGEACRDLEKKIRESKA